MPCLTLSSIIQGIAAGKFSSHEITTDLLATIKKLNPEYNAFITITEDLALEQARNADQKIATGQASPYTAAPIAHKDIFCTHGVRTSCGSRMLDNFIAPYDATVVEKMKQQGCVMLGKTNMDEFAMGSSNETSFYGPVKNPWNPACVPGGSSGGSAAAVAARMVPAATATDTGGSIRQPAALCGISGLKPTYGRVSRHGMVAFASSLDQAGPMATDAKDLAIMMNMMAGYDHKDSTSVDQPIEDYTQKLHHSIKGVKIGVLPDKEQHNLPTAVQQRLQESMRQLEQMGANIQEMHLPHAHHALAVYYIIAPAECSANLARYDGIRYGYRAEPVQDLQELYHRTRSEGFGKEVQRRIMIGTYVLSAGYYDAYYVQAQKVRRLIKEDFTQAFQQVDAILMPSSPTPAFKIGAKNRNPIDMYMEDFFTIPASLAGVPALSMPIGFMDHLPIGAQLIGNYFTESRLLNIAYQYQQCTDWHKKVPISAI